MMKPFTKFVSKLDLGHLGNSLRWGVLAVVALIFTFILYPSLVVTQHEYRIGDVAEKDIKAPKDFFIEDAAATEVSRKVAADAVLTVYDHDRNLAPALADRVQNAFGPLREGIAAMPADPVVGDLAPGGATDGLPSSDQSRHEKIWLKKVDFEERLGIEVDEGAYTILEKEGFSRQISEPIARILTAIMENGVVANKEILLREGDRGIVLRDIKTKTEIQTSKLKRFYELDQAKTMVRIIGQPMLKDHNYIVRNLVVDFAQRLVQPNITLNRSETEERKREAAAHIAPILEKIKAGEMILREGERVTESQLRKLATLNQQTHSERVLTTAVGASVIIICLLIACFVIYDHQPERNPLGDNRTLLFIAAALVTFLFLAKVSWALCEILAQSSHLSLTTSSLSFGIPLAAGAMVVCLFVNIHVAVAFATVLAVCAGFLFHSRFDLFLYFLLDGVMAAYWVRDCRERKVFVIAGLKVALFNVLLATAIGIYAGQGIGFRLLWDWLFAALGGLGAGVVTAGLAPLIETAFGFTTDIKLLELANLDQPILRKLMINAPGTYHHSVIVGSMVEAAAAEIGANPLLAKVCGYYHDVGKLKKPLYFVENQANRQNKHDKLAPSMSRNILVAHVKDGVRIAQEQKLGRAIIDTIQQSHGTSLIRFFYEKACKLYGPEKVTPDDYRYPGPKPQTREAGLVMLADVIEAASRTLENPTPARIQGLVQNLMNRIFSDGQLDDCELTLKDLHAIAKSFNKILNGIHHHRVEYSDNLVVVKGKKENGGTDRQPAKPAQHPPEEADRDGSSHLKRLGLS